jgi:hypothetical protein
MVEHCVLKIPDLESDPGPAASSAFVDRIQSFRYQTFEVKLLSDPEQVPLLSPVNLQRARYLEARSAPRCRLIPSFKIVK